MTSGTGTCTVHYNQAGDSTYNPATEVIENTTAQMASQTIIVYNPAPPTANNGTVFYVQASATSGLPVAITSTGVCNGSGANSATITMTSGTGTCTVHYNQAGDSTYNPATEVIENTTAQMASQTIIVYNPAPPTANNGTVFYVQASATSGLPVAITSTGVCNGSGANSATITMTSGTGTCTVHYNQAGDSTYNPALEVTESTTATVPSYALTVTPSGSGAVRSNPAGVSCGSDCSESYDEGTIVTLKAAPTNGYYFAGWSGGCVSQSLTCKVTMDVRRRM